MSSHAVVARSRAAFTLIELLVVVAIIALLLSILLPSLNRAREQARQLLCATNLRTMGQASFDYAARNQEWIVRSESYRRGAGWGMHFAAALLPGCGYNGEILHIWDTNDRRKLRDACRDTEAFQCPDFPVERQALDYVVNAFRFPYRPQNGDDPGKPGDGPVPTGQNRVFFSRLSTLDKMPPATRIFVAEAHQDMPFRINNNWGTLFDLFIPRHLTFASEPRVANDQRHPGGVNNLFFDGHVQTLSLQRMDVGWPHPVWDRLRLFSEMRPEDMDG